MSKVAKNLLLGTEAIARGEQYGKLHGTNLSRLVDDFLRGLPLEVSPIKSPVVRRLHGIAAGGKSDREDYREHLSNKYGES